MKLVAAAYFRLFEPILAFNDRSREDTTRALRAARIGMFPEWYLSLSYVSAAVGALACGVLTLVAALALGTVAPVLGTLLVMGVGAAVFCLVRLGFLLHPRLVAAARGSRIDAEYPAVVMMCYALARGGMQVVQVFRSVAEEKETYGEIATEFGVVIRNLEWFGMDLNAALMDVAETTPSKTLKGFIEGLVTIIKSGADPRDFFRRQAETQLDQAEAQMEQELETTGMLAEVYVSGLLVLPLLLIVVISVLSSLGNGGTQFIPLLIFLFIPLGTAAYLLMLETLMPPPGLTVPDAKPPALDDFGMACASNDTPTLPWPKNAQAAPFQEEPGETPNDPKAARRLRRQLQFQRALGHVRIAWRSFVERALLKPVDAMDVSGVAGVLLVLVGAFQIWSKGVGQNAMLREGTTLLFGTLLTIAIPVSIFHELRVRRATRVEQALPMMLSRLSGFNERGISLLRAFQILGQTATGPLAKELKAVDRDVSWNSNLGAALRRMRDRADTRRMMHLSVLFQRASAATGNLKDVLQIATNEATRRESLASRKRSSMASYVVVVYVVFAVFLYVVYMVATLFYGEGGFAAAAADASSSSGGLGGGLDPDTARLLFFHAVLIQGVASGFVAGKLGEGHLLSGLKHAAILGTIAWVVFTLGVYG